MDTEHNFSERTDSGGGLCKNSSTMPQIGEMQCLITALATALRTALEDWWKYGKSSNINVDNLKMPNGPSEWDLLFARVCFLDGSQFVELCFCLQMVYANATAIGCAVLRCPDITATFVECEYNRLLTSVYSLRVTNCHN